MSSVDCEWAFSLSGRVVTPLRAVLSDANVHASVLLNSWRAIPGLLSEEEFSSSISEGWNRKNNVIVLD